LPPAVPATQELSLLSSSCLQKIVPPQLVQARWPRGDISCCFGIETAGRLYCIEANTAHEAEALQALLHFGILRSNGARQLPPQTAFDL